MIKKLIFIVICAFLMGWMSHSIHDDLASALSTYHPESDLVSGNLVSSGLQTDELQMPADRIPSKAINVKNEEVVLDIENPEWSKFTDTKSMDPVLGKGAYGIHIVPEEPSDITRGDIVAYNSEYAEGTIIHRIIEIGEDEEGTYYKLRGDNNPEPDPGKVRFEQIERVLVAIVY